MTGTRASLIDTARVLRHAAAVGSADYTAMHTWRTWTFAWLTRVVAEVSFFGLIGTLLGSREAVTFLVTGNAVLIASAVTLVAVQSSAWERMAGTLPLLAASPTRPLVVFLGRSAVVIPDALASSFTGLAVASLVFRLDLPLTGFLLAPPVLLAGIAGTYGLAALCGALVLRTINARNLVSNLTRYIMAVVIGANVSVAFFPDWVGWFSKVFPATFALRSLRHVLAGDAPAGAVGNIGWCLVVGLIWLTVAAIAFHRFAEHGRQNGTIDLG